MQIEGLEGDSSQQVSGSSGAKASKESAEARAERKKAVYTGQLADSWLTCSERQSRAPSCPARHS